jgi:hypothetical protein
MVDTNLFCLEATDWQWMLSNACVRAGLPLELEYIKAKVRGNFRHYPGMLIEGIIECSNLLIEVLPAEVPPTEVM